MYPLTNFFLLCLHACNIFQWLKEDFLEKYINQWQESSLAILQIPKDERHRLCLSHQTLDGIRITGKNTLI